MSRFEFTKMQGLGNDFIVLEGPAKPRADDVVRLCDRRFGIGADGVLVVTRGTPIVMDYWNADGSAAEMCGNGLRCVARYAYDGIDRVIHEKRSKRSGGTNEFALILGGRFVVSAKGNGVELNDLKTAVATMDLAKLETMKNAGAKD